MITKQRPEEEYSVPDANANSKEHSKWKDSFFLSFDNKNKSKVKGQNEDSLGFSFDI